jgi:hypothetical protein
VPKAYTDLETFPSDIKQIRRKYFAKVTIKEGSLAEFVIAELKGLGNPARLNDGEYKKVITHLMTNFNVKAHIAREQIMLCQQYLERL